ncbi:hypothetical protein SAMN05660284_00093 [Formivibrio citricus]|uniref:Uncharacterized protein n=1 Tax=Formivibrio citricus TaxID=83765 RepID=A0A1I4V2I7_9NEIS|nr:hypothetical protein [Formivibrio citricus]SFM95398.1 hypothetical protein SAMN05660284_00093 [Formivibrio citricus]
MFKLFRVVILLFILFVVGAGTVLTKWRSTSWKRPQQVAVYPLNADGRPQTQQYIAGLTTESFAPVTAFFEREAKHYQLPIGDPVYLKLGPQIQQLPPEQPAEGRLAIMLYSLQLRWWAWKNDAMQGYRPDIRLFVLYHDPALSPRLPHSLGLEKGQIGVVHAFADREMTGSNQVVMVHELLHTLGATDKYGPGGLPSYPDGYADPERQPRYPQIHAEIMGGRIPMSPDQARTPESLKLVLVGEVTAREIGWRR